MDLYLIRHAEAVALGEQGIADDADRPLTEAGVKEARALGRELRRRGMTLDKLVTSPLLRAKQTADGILKDWPEPPDLVECEDLALDADKFSRLGRFLRDLGVEN